MTGREWWRDHDNIVTLTAYMAETGYSASEVAYAVEKPWKFEDVFHATRQLCHD